MKKRRIPALLLFFVLLLQCCSPMIVTAAGKQDDLTATVRFADIQDSETEFAVESLRLMNVLDGYQNGTFRPNVVLNRAQFCKMVVQILDAEEELGRYQTVTVFPDVKPSYWAAAYINLAAKGKHVIAGYADGCFHPERMVTVGQAVTILMRVLGYEDEKIGGVWPYSYMAAASVAGLTEELSLSAEDGLTRGQAAKLFVNLLQADTAESGSYLEGVLKCSTVSDSLLVSCDEKSEDGRENAIRLSNGSTYTFRSGKTINKFFNGSKGTLVLDAQGKAVTFLADTMGDTRIVTISTAKSTEITDLSGNHYKVKDGTTAYYQEEEKPWTEIFAWLNPGAILTLYLDKTGEVEYILAGSGTTSDSAVIIQDDKSAIGFKDLSGNAENYKIYKNGVDASVGDLRQYDVATYSAAENAIRVCDTKIAAYYRSCWPNPQEPERITIFEDTVLKVLPSAWESLSNFNPGDIITVLLTEDNRVAAVLDNVMSNAMGIVKSISSDSATVDLLCGLTVKGSGAYLESTVQSMDGQLVRVASDKKGALGLSRPVSGASGDLNLEARTMGGKRLAKNLIMFRNSSGKGMEIISLDELEDKIISSTEISYVRTNWKDEVDLIVFGSGLGSAYVYGIAEYTAENGKIGTLTVQSGGKSVSVQTPYVADTGEIIGVSVTGSGPNRYLAGVVRPMKVPDVPNSAWSGRTSVTAGGRTYSVPSSVVCYNSRTKDWITLDEAHAYAEKADLYIHNGAVRMIQVN